MATNNFKPFAIGNGANVTSQNEYEQLDALLAGFQAGKASSAQINKALRQSSVMAHVLAQFISDSAGVDVLDNGIPANILTSLKAGMVSLTPGRLINIQILVASGTYIPTPGTKSIIVEQVGGGAGGAPCAGVNSNTASYSGGGGSGAYAKYLIKRIPDSVPYSLGSGGNSGQPGGVTTFGSYCSTSGGMTGSNGTTGTQGIAGGGSGGQLINQSSVISIINSKGSGGVYGLAVNTAGGNGGNGGSSLIGLGGKGSPNGAGQPGDGYGAGGGGCFLPAGGASSTQPGGSGSGGAIIVWEYA